MEGFSGSSIPSSSALPWQSESGLFSKPKTGQAIDNKLAALKHKYTRLEALKLRSAMLQAQRNQELRDGKKSELPSVSSKVVTENIPTNDQINLSFCNKEAKRTCLL